MNKYCMKCGKELEEGSKFCKACGTPVGSLERKTNSQSNSSASKKSNSTVSKMPNAAKRPIKKENKSKYIISAIAIAVIIIGAFIYHNSVNGYKSPINKLEAGINDKDVSKVLDAFDIENQSTSEDAAYWINGCDSVEFEIKKTQHIDSKELKSKLEAYGVDEIVRYYCTDAYMLECNAKEIEDGEHDNHKIFFVVAKVDGTWKIVEYDK